MVNDDNGDFTYVCGLAEGVSPLYARTTVL